MSLNTRIAVLKSAAFALLIGPGLIMVVGLVSPLMGLVNAFLDLAYQPLDGGQEVVGGAARLLNGILGGVLVGFGVMIWLVAEKVYKNDQDLGRNLIMIPLLCWFATDSAGSVLAGAWFNAVLNASILGVFLAALLWPAQANKTAHG